MEEELKEAQQSASNNKAAADILTQMIADGDAEQDELGAVKVSKRRPDAANLIGNMNDFWVSDADYGRSYYSSLIILSPSSLKYNSVKLFAFWWLIFIY